MRYFPGKESKLLFVRHSKFLRCALEEEFSTSTKSALIHRASAVLQALQLFTKRHSKNSLKKKKKVIDNCTAQEKGPPLLN